MKNAIKLPFLFDADRMLSELQSIQNSFVPIRNQYTGESLFGMHLIVPNADGSINEKGESFHLTKELQQCSYLQEVLHTFPCDKFTYRAQNLRSGGLIKKHNDGDKGLKHRWIRLNIPVSTNEKVHTYFNGERIPMKNGECWLPNVVKDHWMENQSDATRWLLLLDCGLNDWWKTVLKDCGLDLENASKFQYQSLEELENIKQNLLFQGLDERNVLVKEIAQEILSRTT